MRALYVSLLITLVGPVCGTESQPFSWLKKITVDDTPVGDIEILYNPNNTKIINVSRNEEGYEFIRVLKTKIDSKSNYLYEVEYFEGMSVDPGFTLIKSENGQRKEIYTFGGTRMIIPGNGYIYTDGHTNTVFNERKKYRFEDDKVVEVPQPYYYIGLKTKTNKEIKIFSTKKMNNEVAKLTKGTEVEVILNEGEYYLVVTKFGLVGWFKPGFIQPAGLDHKSDITGLYFKGD